MRTVYAKYVTTSVPNYYRVRFFVDGKLVYSDTVREGRDAIYEGKEIPELKGWSRLEYGPVDPKAGSNVRANRDLFAVTDERSLQITLGQIKYILKKLPTRNTVEIASATITPDDVYYDPDLDLWIYDLEVEGLNGTEWATVEPDTMEMQSRSRNFINPVRKVWATVVPDVMELQSRREYARVAPIRKHVHRGLVKIQLLDKPREILNVLVKIQNYVDLDNEVQAEKTMVTREELIEAFGGVIPTRNEIISSVKVLEPDKWEGNIYPIVLDELDDNVDSIELDSADDPEKTAHKLWGAADFTYTASGNTIYLIANKVVPNAVLKMNCRVTKTTEVL